MYIVRWLMGHPIIATWVLGAVAILLTVGSGKKEAISEQDSSSKDNVEVGTTTKLNDDKKVVVEKEINLKDKPNPIVEDDISISDVPNSLKNTSDINNLKSSKGLETASKTVSISSDKNEVKLVPEVSDSPVESDDLEAKDSAIADLGQATSEEMLLMAREAYWNNGLDEAAQIYKKLIKIEPKILEHRGELGNVYWRQGYPKKAAELYSEIAIPMIEEGGSERVANMIGFIGLFYPDRASEIHKRMQSEIIRNDVQQ